MSELIGADRWTLLKRDTLNAAMLAAVAQCESRFSVRFASFLWLPEPMLAEWTISDGSTEFGVNAVSRTNEAVRATLTHLTKLANQPSLTREDRERYRQILEDIFRLLPVHPDPETLVVAPRREGAILARRLGWLAATKHLEPHLKRIPFDGGLLVGCDDTLKRQTESSIDLVDGALATGATAMAVLAICRPAAARLFCAHATAQGLRALQRFAAELHIDLHCYAGDVSGVLNDHFYAVLPENPALVCVGDLGDTIAPLESD